MGQIINLLIINLGIREGKSSHMLLRRKSNTEVSFIGWNEPAIAMENEIGVMFGIYLTAIWFPS